MANEIVIAKGPELGMVLDIYEKEFVEHIIDNYCYQIEKQRCEEEVPSMFEINYHPKFIYASFLYMENDGDMQIIEDEMNRYKTDDELISHCLDELDNLEEVEPELMQQYQDGMIDDIIEVLEFHKMCYFQPFYDPFRGKTTWYLENCPSVQIW